MRFLSLFLLLLGALMTFGVGETLAACPAGMQEAPGSSLCVPTTEQVGLTDGEGADNGIAWALLQVLLFITEIISVLAIIVIVWAGLSYITSGGDSGRVDRAKGWLLYGIIGLTVALLAFVIVTSISTALQAG